MAFYFYYPDDIGFGSHQDDLEQVQIDVDVLTDYEDCAYALKISRITGFAHGWSLYSNILEIDDGGYSRVSLPITILVEEGKHARAPDRNGDGHFTPGFDVNRRVQDGWGVRDVLRGGRMVGAKYEASMTKVRVADYRVGPNTYTNRDLIWQSYEPTDKIGVPQRGYALISLPDWRPCRFDEKNNVLRRTTRPFDLCEAVRQGHRGNPLPVDRVPTWLTKAFKPFSGVVGFSAMYDSSISGPMVTFRTGTEAPRVGGWITAAVSSVAMIAIISQSEPERADFAEFFYGDNRNAYDFSIGYSPSASRWSDWYFDLVYRATSTARIVPVEGTYAYWNRADGLLEGPYPVERMPPANVLGIIKIDEQLVFIKRQWRSTTEFEGGYRFRFKVGPAALHVRTGLRWPTARPVGDARILFGVGLGPWRSTSRLAYVDLRVDSVAFIHAKSGGWFRERTRALVG